MNKKRVLTLVFSFILIFSFSFSVAAEDLHVCVSDIECTEENSTEDAGISPFYVVSCPQGGKHTMVGRGVAWIYSGSFNNPGSLQLTGFASQCTKCHLVLGSEGSMYQSRVIGRYALYSAVSPVSNAGVNIFGGINGSFYGNVSQDSFWSGFEWY